MNNHYKVIILTALIAAAIGGLAGGMIASRPIEQPPKTDEQRIREFYETENAVHVSPHHIRKHLAQGDKSFVLVDLRSSEEYQTAHIAGALSVPAYVSPDKSAYGDVNRIVNGFRDIQAKHPNTEIIVYCYSAPCMTGRKIGKMLTEHDIYVKHLGIGWQEWRYYWNMWNHDGETAVNPADYVVSGPDPGTVQTSNEPGDTTDIISPCSVDSEFGC